MTPFNFNFGGSELKTNKFKNREYQISSLCGLRFVEVSRIISDFVVEFSNSKILILS